MAEGMQAGLGRIARELRDMTAWHGRGGSAADTRAELARLWSRIEDIVEHRLDAATQEVSRDARAALRSTRAQIEHGRDAALDAAGQLRDATRAHPLVALGIAAAAAWALASLIRARR
jgi:ElaB/YqjD/DUF883 family membrane-anchored ribosome-binding protein